MHFSSGPITILSEYKNILQQSVSRRKEIKLFFQQMKALPNQRIDQLFHIHHQQVFKEIDCLKCANCCKTTSPIILQKDIHSISRYLKISASSFIQEYLIMDEEGDFVFKKAPCPFLQRENTCSIYDARPKACKDYPHTNRKRMREILSITYENVFVCPAVSKIVQAIEKEISRE